MSNTGLNKETIDMFDQALALFIWPEVDDCKLLASMNDPQNFCKNTYPLAVGTYLTWMKQIFPHLTENEKEDLRIPIAQSVLNILHVHAKQHHIHLALQKY